MQNFDAGSMLLDDSIKPTLAVGKSQVNERRPKPRLPVDGQLAWRSPAGTWLSFHGRNKIVLDTGGLWYYNPVEFGGQGHGTQQAEGTPDGRVG